MGRPCSREVFAVLRAIRGRRAVVTTTACWSMSCRALSGANSDARGMKLMTASNGLRMEKAALESASVILLRVNEDSLDRGVGREMSRILSREGPDTDWRTSGF